jgi:hypothetical protein
MPTVDLTAEELTAIDTACMVVNEHVRLGRKKQKDYIQFDDDPIGAELLEPSIQKMDAARATLRGLLARAKEVSNANQ